MSSARGERTRRTILDSGLDLASEVGLHRLSFGELAKRTSMSKSGLFAHFDGKDQLQLDVLDAATERFGEVVLRPSFLEPRGIPRIERLFALWLHWGAEEFPGGCPFMRAASELETLEPPVRERLATHLRALLEVIARTARIAVENGHFRHDLDCDQFAYTFWSTLITYEHYARLLGWEDARHRATRAFRGLLHSSRTP